MDQIVQTSVVLGPNSDSITTNQSHYMKQEKITWVLLFWVKVGKSYKPKTSTKSYNTDVA